MTDHAGPIRRPSIHPADRECEKYVAPAILGDQAALEHLVSCVHDPVVRYCRVRLRRADGTFQTADDVAQDVCMAVITALPRYRREGPFLAFVYGIALRKLIDCHRATGRDRSEPVADVPERPDAADGPELIALRREMAQQVGRLLDCLSDRQRDILMLRVVEGLSAAETATAVGSTPGAVRLAQHRALERVRRHYRETTDRSEWTRADCPSRQVKQARTADRPPRRETRGHEKRVTSH